MTGDSARKVTTGAPLRVSADAWNELTDALRDRRAHRHDAVSEVAPQVRQAGVVLVRNLTGAGLDRFAVLALGDPIISPTENDLQFKAEVTFDGGTPSISTPAGRYCVLLEPVPAGGIARAVVAGVVPVRLLVSGSLQEFAAHTAGSTEALTSSASGSSRVLWAESSGSPRWAVVRLGDGSTAAGGGARPTVTGYYPDSVLAAFTSVASPAFIQFEGSSSVGGFYISEPTAGVALVELGAATPARKGGVTTTTQTFGGDKTFNNDVILAGGVLYIGESGRSLLELAAASGDHRIMTLRCMRPSSSGTTESVGLSLATDGYEVRLGASDGSSAVDWVLHLDTASGQETGQTGTFEGLEFVNGWLVGGSFSLGTIDGGTWS